MDHIIPREWQSHGRAVILLGLCGLVAFILAGYPIQQPGTMDSYYYYEGGQSLLENRAFVEPYIWNYLDPVDGPSGAKPPILDAAPLHSGGASQDTLGHNVQGGRSPFCAVPAVGLPIVSYLTSWGLGRNRCAGHSCSGPDSPNWLLCTVLDFAGDICSIRDCRELSPI